MPPLFLPAAARLQPSTASTPSRPACVSPIATSPTPTRPRRKLGVRFAGVLCALALLLPPAGATGAPAAESDAAAEPRVIVYQLANGLRVVLDVRQDVPLVSVCLSYRAGSSEESLGQSGLAHLLEHLMFEGSLNLDSGEHQLRIAALGGRANGLTNKDRAQFFSTVPAQALEPVLWMEAERMRHLALSPEKFENQRQVVLEEYRKRYANSGYGLGPQRLSEIAYLGAFAYQHPTIGYVEDVERLRFADVQRFHAEHYGPDRAVLAISGTFDPVSARDWIERYFGPARPPRPLVAREVPTDFPRQTTERLNVMEDPRARQPAVFEGWLVPPFGTRMHRVLEVALEILVGGNTSRLVQTQVLDKASARAVGGWLDRRRGVSLLGIRTDVSSLSNVDNNQHWLDEQLTLLRERGPRPDELSRAKARLARRWLERLQLSEERARLLADRELLWNHANEVLDEPAAYRDVSVAEVQRAVSLYISGDRRTVVEVYPPGWARDLGPTVVTQIHTVKSGENLSVIAQRYASSVAAIVRANRLRPGKPILPGQKLFVTLGPKEKRLTVKTYTVKKGDTLIGIAKKHGVSVAQLTRENAISRKKPIRIGQTLKITLSGGGKAAETEPKKKRRKK